MAGFETVVRPMILPNIRPAVAQRIVNDDPEQGKCVISGQGAATITNTYTNSVSITRSGATETKRQFDEVRIYSGEATGGGAVAARGAREASQTDGPYIDVEVVKKIWLKGNGSEKFTRHYAEVELEDNMVLLNTDMVRSSK